MTKIVTHPGIFHADDALAVATLLVAGGMDRLQNLEILRRNPEPSEVATNGTVVVDVGGVFEAHHWNFDHHQRGGAGTRDDGTPFAAAGLVWNFAMTREPELIDAFRWLVMGGCALDTPVEGTPQHSKLWAWHRRVDEMLFKGVDANDTGKGRKTEMGEAPNLSQIVSWLNPGPGASDAERDQAFMKAVELCSTVLKSVALSAWAWVTAREKVLKAYTEFDGRVLVLEKFVPWNEHIFQREDADNLLYVVFPSERGGYMIQQVPVSAESFDGRKPLPETWAGKRTAELQVATGVDDAIFCHPGRFCAGANSFVGTMALARLAVSA